MALEPEGVWPVWCTAHGGDPAIALCSDCQDFLCASCREVGTDGRAFCPQCARKHGLASDESDEQSPDRGERLFDLIKNAIRRPRVYAERIDPHGRLRPAFYVGMVANITGELATLLWLVLLVRTPEFASTIREGAEQLGVSTERFQLIILAMIPVSAAMRLAFGAVLLQLGAALAGAKRALGFKGNFRIFCYASVAQFLLLLPFVGIFLALWYILIICWTVQHKQYGLTSRQTLIAVAPLAVGTILMGMVGAG